jgi:hypothetical protein
MWIVIFSFRNKRSGINKMKIRAFLTAIVIAAGFAGPSLAFENPTRGALHALTPSAQAGRLLHNISCNVNDENKQAYCMRACEEAYIAGSESYSESLDYRKKVRKECETKCGC